MKQLFVTDMDGTLLGTDSRVSSESARIITDLTRAGALITVATARTPATVEPLLSHTATTPPAIVMTGAALWDRSAQRLIDPMLMSDDVARRVTRVCLDQGLRPLTYTIGTDGRLHVYFHGEPNREEEQFISERMGLKLKKFHLLPADSIPPSRPSTIIIFTLGTMGRIEAAARQIHADIDCSAWSYPDIFDPSAGMMDIYADGVSKARAVLRMKERVGADELVVFGDNLNDLPMMAVADRAVAVANALPEVLEAADEVIGPNSSDSVARYIADHAEL